MSGDRLPAGGDVESRLLAAAAGGAWPATPDLRGPVLARLAGAVAAPTAGTGLRGRSPARGGWTLVRALAVALLALLLLAGAAAALGFRLPGMDILRVDRLPGVPGPAGAPVSTLAVVPGSPVPLDEARAVVPPRVLVPDALPAPSTAWVEGTGDGRLVTLAWHAAGRGPTIAGTDLALVLTAAPGGVDEPLLTKVLGPGTTIEPVSVGGDRGWWIAGAPHELFLLGPRGDAVVARSRFAGDTLVFARDGTVYRLESALGRDETLRIADSMR